MCDLSHHHSDFGFIVDVPDPGVMQRPPRKPGSRIATRAQTVRWAITGFIIYLRMKPRREVTGLRRVFW